MTQEQFDHLIDLIRGLKTRVETNESVLVAQQKAMNDLADRVLALEQA